VAIISLTSIPPRFAGLPDVLGSLCAQTAAIDEIRLYIPKRYRRFSGGCADLPDLPKPVQIIEVAEDLGPASKLLYCADHERGSDTPIVFCDDDRRYHPNWAQKLLAAHRTHPKACVATHGLHIADRSAPVHPQPRARFRREWADVRYRGVRLCQKLQEGRLHPRQTKPLRRPVKTSGFADVFFGYGGAVVTSAAVDRDVFEIPDALWMVDDYWLSGHFARKGVPIWLPQNLSEPTALPQAQIDPLMTAVFDGATRQMSNAQAVAYFQSAYGVWT